MCAAAIPTRTAADVPPGAHLLDVREPEEWNAGHAPGAQHVPMGQLPARLAEVPTDQEVVVVCRVGGRSARVVEFLLHQGWHDVSNLEGGMRDWAAAGLPMVAEDGQAARVR